MINRHVVRTDTRQYVSIGNQRKAIYYDINISYQGSKQLELACI